jgi:hypothetical protein
MGSLFTLKKGVYFVKILILIICIVLIIAFVFFYKKHKSYKTNSIAMITGAPKTGKSLLSVYLSLSYIRGARFWYFFKHYMHYLTFGIVKDNKEPMPELYSNIPINSVWGYIPLTKDILLRKKKVIDKSCIYIGECSLVANSRTALSQKEKDLAEQLMLFFKLSGHEFNGRIYCDSQCISDVNYNIKRCLSNYLYIHHSINLPFHKVLFVKELMYSDDNSTININEKDVEEQLKWLLVPKKYYKAYDFRCYSIFTDNLPIENNLIQVNNGDLKAYDVVSFDELKHLKGVDK